MQDVQTFIRTFPPCGRWTRMDCRFGSKRRRVRLFACETLLPNCGPLPQTSHRLAIACVKPPGFKKGAGRARVASHRRGGGARRKRKVIANGFAQRQVEVAPRIPGSRRKRPRVSVKEQRVKVRRAFKTAAVVAFVAALPFVLSACGGGKVTAK